MARFSRRQFSFTHGEVSPNLHERADMEFYFASLAECENFLPDHRGNLFRRPPTRFLTEGKDGQKPCLYPFPVGRDCAVMVLAYEDCFQFLLNRELVLDDTGAALSLPHEYGPDYCDLEFSQDCGALFIAHENHPKQFLQKDGDGFTLTQVPTTPFAPLNTDRDCMLCLRAGGTDPDFDPDVQTVTLRSLDCEVGDIIRVTDEPIPPGAVGPFVQTLLRVTAETGNGVCRAVRLIGAIGPGTYFLTDGLETLGEVTVTVGAALLEAEGCAPFVPEMVGQQVRVLDEAGVGDNQPNTWVTSTVTRFISPTQVIVSYDGQELGCTDLFQLPAFGDGVFPETVHIHQDRLFCGSRNQVVASKTGDFFDFEPTDPDGTVNADNAIYRRINNGGCSDIRWFWPMGRHLLVGTPDGLISLLGAGTNGAFQADAIAEQDNQNIGVADRRPVKVGDGVFFIDRTRTKLYGTAFSGQYDHIGAEDYALFADHIAGKCIDRIAYQEHPFSIIWGTTDDGLLFSLTCVPGQGVKGWARHRLGGVLVKDGCCAAPEVCDVSSLYGADEKVDDVYLVVKRTVGGVDRFFVEMLTEFYEGHGPTDEAGHLDCHLDLANIVTGPLPAVPDGPLPFQIPPVLAAAGAFSVSDGERWYRYNVDGDVASAVAPNTYDTPVAGRDWVNAGTDDDCEWRQLEKPRYCDDPDFASEALHVYRPPCGISRYCLAVDALGGMEHLAGEQVLAFVDGQMYDTDVAADGSVPVGGCVARVGLPYDSTLRLLPFRQNLGSTDGAADPQRPIRVNVSALYAVWLEAGTGRHDEVSQLNAQFFQIELPNPEFDAPQPYSGWIGSDLLSGYNLNDDSQLALRARGPWPLTIRNIEAQVVASGGR